MNHILSCNQFTRESLNEILDLAEKIKNNPKEYQNALKDKIIAVMFFEPSTRTRMSFESAILKLGGRMITTENGKSSSSFTDELGGDLDVITTLPSDCPYTFAKIKTGAGDVDWTWIKIGDDMQQTKTDTTTTFTRTERWAGYTDVDENYYGSETFSHDENGIKTGRWYKNCL